MLRETPELQSCMGDQCAAALQQANGNGKQALRAAFTAIMTCPAEQVPSQLQILGFQVSGLRVTGLPCIQNLLR